ncbi:phosphopantetheine-binding protein [Thiohalomonas denitrificans]|uniref:phosphopantetheine-binding protein n=1 Tax=Thiohalomonas denitrificans TaxID=415747 RepID=UPI0026EF54BC|nr:phosphopantetheine-binding protein [Thiohalomonas denitrificans]
MKGSADSTFKRELKQFIITECDKDASPEEIPDDAPLFGPESPLELDSLDGLQLSVAMERQFGVKITDNKEVRRIFTSIDAFADYVRPE